MYIPAPADGGGLGFASFELTTRLSEVWCLACNRLVATVSTEDAMEIAVRAHVCSPCVTLPRPV
jgi:hypothetical protein